jgi:hypothetical protein
MTADPQSAILVYLRGLNGGGATIHKLATVTKLSTTTVRNHLRVMESLRAGEPWVTSAKIPGTKGRLYLLTETGVRVAGYRASA